MQIIEFQEKEMKMLFKEEAVKSPCLMAMSHTFHKSLPKNDSTIQKEWNVDQDILEIIPIQDHGKIVFNRVKDSEILQKRNIFKIDVKIDKTLYDKDSILLESVIITTSKSNYF